jgi:hypothetical protein
MVEYLMLNKLPDPVQSGFKANHKKTTALLKVGSVLTVFDFSKAFDSIEHKLLLMKLSNYFNFSSSAISMISMSVSDASDGLKSVLIILNPNKTKALFICRSRAAVAPPPVVVSGVTIPYSSKVRDKGMTLNDSLTFDDHINDLCSRVNYILQNLWSASEYIPSKLKLRLVKALVVHQFLFGDVLFRMADSILVYANLRSLSIIVNCVRFVYGLRRYDHVSEYIRNILGFSLSKYHEFRTCCLLFKTIKTTYPLHINENLFLTLNGGDIVCCV